MPLPMGRMHWVLPCIPAFESFNCPGKWMDILIAERCSFLSLLGVGLHWCRSKPSKTSEKGCSTKTEVLPQWMQLLSEKYQPKGKSCYAHTVFPFLFLSLPEKKKHKPQNIGNLLSIIGSLIIHNVFANFIAIVPQECFRVCGTRVRTAHNDNSPKDYCHDLDAQGYELLQSSSRRSINFRLSTHMS